MKITGVKTLHVRKALEVPAGPPGHYNRARESLFVTIGTDAGEDGWGETYALPGARETIHWLSELLYGRNPLEILGSWCPPWLASEAAGTARAAIDMALHDLCGRILQVPVHQLLGGARRDRVRVYASGLLYKKDRHPSELWVDEAASLVELGYAAMKLRIGGCPPSEEVPLLGRLRTAVPAQVDLMVDAWGAYPMHDALKVGSALGALGYRWFEEPLIPEPDHGGYAELARDLPIAVAGGEMVADRGTFRRLFERHALDIVQPDVCICGGLREVLFVAELADLYGVACVPHTWNGGVMNAATLQVLAAMPSRARLEGSDTPLLEYDTTENPFMREVLVDPPTLEDGCFRVPSAAGLGVTVDEGRLRSYAVDG